VQRVRRGTGWRADYRFEIDDPIIHTLPLERINEAFQLMAPGESILSAVICRRRIGPGPAYVNARRSGPLRPPPHLRL
jgi:hypothetical protein